MFNVFFDFLNRIMVIEFRYMFVNWKWESDISRLKYWGGDGFEVIYDGFICFFGLCNLFS